MSLKNLGEVADAVIKAMPNQAGKILARDVFGAIAKEFQKRDKEIAMMREELESLKQS